MPAQPGSAAISNRICDGVIHFRLRAFATNGFPLFSDGVHTNACFRTNAFTPGVQLRSPDPGGAELRATRTIGPASTSRATPFPPSVELELGILEQHAWERYNSIGDPAARLAYLQRADITSRVHLFRQRIPIRNVDPLAYQ